MMASGISTGTTTDNFEYDGKKERVLKTVTSGNAKTTTLYLRGMNDYPLTTKTGSTQSTTNRFYIYGPTGLVAFIDNGVPCFVVKDYLGSTRVVLDGSNNPMAWYDYTPYGNIWRSTVNKDVAYKFTGQEFDPELGLYNFRARLYNGGMGIFYAGDPLPNSFSPYGYARNNPVTYIDKDGQFPWLFFAVAAIWSGAFDAARHNGGDISKWQFKYFAGGAASSMAGFGMGSLLGTGSTLLSTMASSAASSATAGGVEALVEGGDVGGSMLSGAVFGAAGGALSYYATTTMMSDPLAETRKYQWTDKNGVTREALYDPMTRDMNTAVYLRPDLETYARFVEYNRVITDRILTQSVSYGLSSAIKSWSCSIGLFNQIGGQVIVGRNPDGGYYAGLRGGIGEGGGFSYTPNATSPGWQNGQSGFYFTNGVYSDLSVNIGAISGGYGWDASRNAVEDGFHWSVGNSEGIEAVASTGGELFIVFR